MGGLDDPLETMALAFLVDTSQALSTYYMLCVGSHLVKHNSTNDKKYWTVEIQRVIRLLLDIRKVTVVQSTFHVVNVRNF